MSGPRKNEPVPGLVSAHTRGPRTGQPATSRKLGVRPVAYGTAGVLGLVAVLYSCSGSSSAHDRYCVDDDGRRVAATECDDDRGSSAGGGGSSGAHWYYVRSGTRAPGVGEKVSGGSFDAPSRGGFGSHGSGGS